MRDILFKGKRTDNGEWVTGQLYKRSLYYGDPSVKYYIIVSTEDLGYDQALEYYEVIPETVGQFTGYTDGKDKRIFEGDIIRGYHPIWSEAVIGLVEYKFDSFGWYMYEDENILRHIGNLDDTETIGNIYDNPELWEEL